MPLDILIALVIGGIAGIAVLTHLMGWSTPRRLADTAEAAAAFTREFPTARVTRVTLCRDGRAALVETDGGEGVVWSMGADTTARLLHGARITRNARGLTLRLPDWSAPRIRLRLTPEEAARWTREIEEHPA